MRKQDQWSHRNTNFIHTGTCQRMCGNTVFTTPKTTSEATLVRKGLLHLKASRIPTETTSFITQITGQKNTAQSLYPGWVSIVLDNVWSIFQGNSNTCWRVGLFWGTMVIVWWLFFPFNCTIFIIILLFTWLLCILY